LRAGGWGSALNFARQVPNALSEISERVHPPSVLFREIQEGDLGRTRKGEGSEAISGSAANDRGGERAKCEFIRHVSGSFARFKVQYWLAKAKSMP
jgi:hypothetical protein